MAHPGGRPPKYKTPLEMQVIVDKYFKECQEHVELVEEWVEARHPDGQLKKDENGLTYFVKVKHRRRIEAQPLTMAGLARRLGMDRRALVDYKKKDEFLPTIKEARARIMEYNEAQLHSGKQVTGAIFNLKVNFDYKEEDEAPPPENPIIFINNVPIGGESEAEPADN